MKTISKAILVLSIMVLSACASIEEAANPTAEGLQPKTAGVLGYMPDEVKISKIDSDGSNTYYLADTPKGTYACQVMSGTMTAYSTAGYSMSPTCTKR